jgi:tetratricopeptide (TPR) repeat protein
LVILLLAIAGNAAAQTDAPPSTPPTTPSTPPSTTDPTLPGSDDDPRALFDRGSALYALGRYAEAAPLFERAFELKADPALLFNAAQAYRFMGNKQRALTLYQNYIRLYGDTIPNADDVRHQIDQLKEAIAVDERAKTAPPTGVQSPQTSGAPTLIASAPPPPKRTLVKRPWFWVAVGGGAAVVITAIAVGVAVGTRGHTEPNASFGTVSGN